MSESPHNSKQKILDAALAVIRRKGYNATRIEDVCAEAGVTKGSFFHHFKGKEALAVEAANYWSSITGELFANAPYHQHEDPLARVLAYVDFRKELIAGDIPDFTCLVGTMAQEIYGTAPLIRDACNASICDHAAKVEADIKEAMVKYHIDAEWSAESLALHTQAVLQGAFILAKSKTNADVARESVDHLRRYIQLLFNQNDQT